MAVKAVRALKERTREQPPREREAPARLSIGFGYRDVSENNERIGVGSTEAECVDLSSAPR